MDMNWLVVVQANFEAESRPLDWKVTMKNPCMSTNGKLAITLSIF